MDGSKLLEKAVREVLICPYCEKKLLLKDEFLLCVSCRKDYPLINGIPVFINGTEKEQKQERIFRDSLKYDSFLSDENAIFKEVGRHHSVPAMRYQSKSFISNFKSYEWVLDMGVGFAWHWKNNNSNKCHILGVDFSITNLKVARRLLGDGDNVLLLCADAARLPFKNSCISGIWSVQTFQHFPEIVFEKAKSQVCRVLKDTFIVEIVNLNPSSFLKIASLLFGKRFIPHKDMGNMELNRLSAKELENSWSNFGREVFMGFSYSELFFHTPYFKPPYYPIVLEKIISRFPQIAKHIARQIHLKMISREM